MEKKRTIKEFCRAVSSKANEVLGTLDSKLEVKLEVPTGSKPGGPAGFWHTYGKTSGLHRELKIHISPVLSEVEEINGPWVHCFALDIAKQVLKQYAAERNADKSLIRHQLEEAIDVLQRTFV